jgi:hypothetical protein
MNLEKIGDAPLLAQLGIYFAWGVLAHQGNARSPLATVVLAQAFYFFVYTISLAKLSVFVISQLSQLTVCRTGLLDLRLV